MDITKLKKQIDEAFTKERAEQEQMIAKELKEAKNGKEEKEN